MGCGLAIRESGRCHPGIVKTAGGVPERVQRLLDVWAGEVSREATGNQGESWRFRHHPEATRVGPCIAQARNRVRRGPVPVAGAAMADLQCLRIEYGSTHAVPEAINLEPRPREVSRDGQSITHAVASQWRHQPHGSFMRPCSNDRLTREPLGYAVCGVAPQALKPSGGDQMIRVREVMRCDRSVTTSGRFAAPESLKHAKIDTGRDGWFWRNNQNHPLRPQLAEASRTVTARSAVTTNSNQQLPDGETSGAGQNLPVSSCCNAQDFTQGQMMTGTGAVNSYCHGAINRSVVERAESEINTYFDRFYLQRFPGSADNLTYTRTTCSDPTRSLWESVREQEQGVLELISESARL